MAEEKKIRNNPTEAANTDLMQTVAAQRNKFVIFGEEMIEKTVNACGKSGRVYLPSDWVGHLVKITRID